MKYKILVSFKGTHLFETNPEYGYSLLAIETLLKLFNAKFPNRDGFKVSVEVRIEEISYYTTVNEFMSRQFVKKAPGRE